MPWCEECAKYYAPSAMHVDGTCPTCGRELEAPVRPDPERVTAKNIDLKQLAAGDGDDDDEGAPWHFKLLMVLLVLYLAWRVVNLFR